MGLGSFWDPNDHPRGWHGRFAKKWKISDALRGILDHFTPRTFQSDSQAGQYAFNQGHKNGPFSSVELTRVRKDWDEAQDHLRAADMDPQTKAFDDMMQSHMRPTAEGLIATKTFGPDALGLRPDQLHDGPGGITDLFGTVVGDKGYGAVHLGTDVTAGQHGPGKISMTILVPAGTKAAFPGQSPQDRGFFLDKEQPLLITRVDPDGMGGWRIAAVAEPHPGAGNSQVSQELNPGRKGVGLTPEERAARLVEPSTMPTPAAPPAAPATEAVLRPESVQAPAVARTPEQEAARVARAEAGRQANVNEGNPAVQAPLPTPNPREAPAPPPAAGPPSPTGVPDRNEPIHSPSIGATGTEGKSASEIATKPPEPTPEAPPALSPSEQGKTLKDAYMESGIESPAAGPQRAAFNRAYLKAKSPTGHPEQALRDLEKDIKGVEQKAAEQKINPSDHPEMLTAEADAKSMNDLADLIATHFGLPRAKKEEKAPESPVKRTGEPDEFLGAPKAGAREASKVSGAPSKAQTGLTTHEQAGSGPGTAGVGGRKEGAPETPAPRGSSGTAKEAEKPTVSAARVKSGDVVLARKDENGKWVHTSRKTGATPIKVTGKQSGNGSHVIEGTDPDGNKVTLEPIRGQNVLHRHQEKAPKAPAAKKAAKAAEPNPDSILRQPGQENLTDREMRAADRKRNPGAQLSEAQKADIAEKAARADARQKAAQEAPLSRARQESMPKFMQTPAGEPASPNLEARQGADSAGVDRVLKAYNDIVARGDGHDRRVSIADIRAEVGGDLSRAELTRALREVGRGGSGHGGLLSRGVKPDARTEANGMDMGGEKVHFLQLPRPGEAGRGGETTPHAKEEPAKKVAKAAAKAAPEQSSPVEAHPSFDAKKAKTFSPVTQVKHADIVDAKPGEKTTITPEWGGEQHFVGPWVAVKGEDGKVAYGSALSEWNDMHERVPGTTDGWQKTATVDAYQHTGAPTKVSTVLADGTVETENTVNPGDWVVKQKNGEVQIIRDDKFRKLYDTEAPAAKAPGAGKAAPSTEATAAVKKAYEDIVGRRGPEGDRKVSLQDIRQELELQHSFSRPEVDKALRELSRGGSEHGGLISRATGKPSNREAAGAMKMGGEDVHFLQLPRPGEAGRGGETTPSAPEAPTPEAPAAEAKSLDKMTKAELLAHPDAAGAKQSWTKDKIKQHIQAAQGAKAAATQQEAEKVLGKAAPRPAAPIDNAPRANEFTKAWDAAGIPEPAGSAGRSMKEIRQDVADGKIDPAEGVRRMESEISFNKDELSQVEADLRAPDLTDKQRSDLQAQHAKLSEGIQAQEKASEFMRGHFGGQGDKPTVAEVKEKLPTTFGDRLKAAKPEEMDEVARIQGLDPPKGDTAEEKFDDLIRQTVEKELDSRKAAKVEKAAKDEAARVKKEAREAGKAEFRPGGEKHLDAAKIAEGLGLDENNSYLSDAQAELNDGKTPKQVADRLRFMARGLSDSNAIIHGSVVAGNETPDDKMHRETKLAEGRAVVAKLTELADRIESSKRPRKPRAPSTKLTPTDHVAAKEAAKATGTPVAEVRSAMEDAKKADAKLQELGVPTRADELHDRVIARAAAPFDEAKTADEARRAAVSMHGNLTLADIRKMGAEHGITGRSKKDITDKLIARRFPAPGADEPVTVREAGTPPTKFAIPPAPAAGRVRDASRVPGLSERQWISGGQFHELKAGDPIAVHLGGSKTRQDSVAKVDPDGTLHTKGGYKYGPTSDVQVSKAGTPAAPAKAAKAAVPAKRVAKPGPAAEPRLSPEAEKARLEQERADNMARLAAAKAVPKKASTAPGARNKKTKDGILIGPQDRTTSAGPGKLVLQSGQEYEMQPGDQLVPSPHRHAPGRYGVDLIKADGQSKHVEQDMTQRQATARVAELNDFLGSGGSSAKKVSPAKATPAKKAAKAAPGEARIEAGKFSDKPFRTQTWGGRAEPNDVRFHEDGAIGSALSSMGQDQRLDVGGEPLRNVLGQIATDVNRGTITPAQGLARYRALSIRLPAGSKAKEALDRAIQQIDSPPRKPNLPEGTPPHIRKLAEKLAEIPIARQPEIGRTGRKGELQQVEELARELTNGEPKSAFTAHEALSKLLRSRHESASDAGHGQITDAISEALKEDDAARAAARKARQAGGAGPKAEGGSSARRAAPGIESHRRDPAIQRAVKAILSRTRAGREAQRRVDSIPAPGTGAKQEQEALRLVRSTPVRPALSAATTSRGVSDVLARESEHLTGRPLKVDLTGLHPDVARGFAEGILQAQEAHPQAAHLHSVNWSGTHDVPGAPPGWLAIAYHDGRMTFRRALDWNDMLASYRETSNVYGHRHGVGSTPRDIAIHEYGHMLSNGSQREALERDAHEILRAHHQASGSPMSLPHFVAQNISAYATENVAETLAEAYADVMIHGSRSSNLSQQLYRLILAHNPTRR